MRHILSVIIVLVTTTYSFSQSTVQLDKKYGFKHFVFNTPPSKYKTEINKIQSWDPNSKITLYEYMGEKMNDLFGVSVDKIKLTYYENKLANIQIQFGNLNTDFKQDEYERVLYSLQKLYGQGNSMSVNDQDFILYGGRKWVGKKVTMEVIRLYYKPSESVSGYISISEKALHEKRIAEEF